MRKTTWLGALLLSTITLGAGATVPPSLRTGSDGIDPAGTHMDARQLAALESFMGRGYATA